MVSIAKSGTRRAKVESAKRTPKKRVKKAPTWEHVNAIFQEAMAAIMSQQELIKRLEYTLDMAMARIGVLRQANNIVSASHVFIEDDAKPLAKEPRR